MSLCRWSTNDHLCDLYIYESVFGGYSINVAKMRRKWLGELPPTVPDTIGDSALVQAYVARMNALREIPYEYVPIGLAYDGQSFSRDTAEEAMNVLTLLQKEGYNAPYERLFEMLKGE